MNQKKNNRQAKQDIAKIAPVQYIAINRTPQARKFVVDFGLMPANNMADLQFKMASIVKQFGDKAKKELAKIHPDTGWIMKAMATAPTPAKMEGGITDEFVSAHGKGCECSKCVGLEKHSNFVTNYRSDADSMMANSVMEMNNADGDSGRLAQNSRVSKGAGTALMILAVVALGTLMIASGERQRSYQ